MKWLSIFFLLSLRGFYAVSLQRCTSNCLKCTSRHICSECKEGFYIGKSYNRGSYFYYCGRCQDNCKSCTSPYSCTKCIDGKYNYRHNKNCLGNCNSNCKSCISKDKCTRCNTRNYGPSCDNKCGYGCENYHCDIRTGFCKCKSGWQGNKCDHCVSGFYGYYCNTPCPKGCSNDTCSSKGECYACKTGFQGNTCERCITGRYGVNCDKICPYGCQNNICSTDGRCTDGCTEGFAEPTCRLCIDEKYGNHCDMTCLENCKRCNSGTICLNCHQGYWGNMCKSCPVNCLNCSSTSSCLTCYTGYYGDICSDNCHTNCEGGTCDRTSGSCNSCKSGYYGLFCDQVCPVNCAATVCERNGKCKSCKQGYYGETCTIECQENCMECSLSNGFCKTCFPGYYGRSCDQPCPSFCKSGTTCAQFNGHCTECAAGFYLSHGQCNNKCNVNCRTCKTFSWMCTGCIKGKFGQKYNSLTCNLDCSNSCLNDTCDDNSGHCVYGCVPEYWGETCNNMCPINCKYGECYKDKGTCISGCKEGYSGPKCKCPSNCKCDVNEKCSSCKNGLYGISQDCKCTKAICSDSRCLTCADSTFYAENAACCPCSDTCVDKRCFSGHKCTDGCIDGYYNDDCSRLCKNFDIHCLKCRYNPNLSHVECLKCTPGYFPYGTSKHCTGCSQNCSNKICDLENGTCVTGCKDGYWGYMCEKHCKMHCRSCNQVNGECAVCTNGRYSKNCSKSCNNHCNVTNVQEVCAFHDGACLSGCSSLTRYGTYCEKECSSNCLKNSCDWINGNCLHGCVSGFYGKRCDEVCSVKCLITEKTVCNHVDGRCILGCIDGFHGDKCKLKCSDKCLNNTCDRETSICSYGCLKGYKGATCTEALEQTYADDKTVIGASVGITILAILCAVIMVITLLKRRTRYRNVGNVQERVCMNRIDVKTAVIYAENSAIARETDQCVTEALYAIPNKQKKTVQNVMCTEESCASAEARYADDGKVSYKTAIYENTIALGLKEPFNKGDARSVCNVSLREAKEEEEDLKNFEEFAENKHIEPTADSNGYGSEGAHIYYNAMAQQRNRVLLDQLSDFVSKKTKTDFIEEFQQLPTGLIKPYTESQKKENISKNRYKGIYPYDDTRVILKDGDSDYINASYIDGYEKRRVYIASIGPTYKYMGDMSAFWKMIWQEKIGKIVILTNLTEAEVQKCDQYWPEKDHYLLFADLEITCFSEEIYADYTVRNFVAQKGPETRTVVQLHFTAWPDKGIPDDVTSLVQFRQKVNSTQTQLDGPLLVHCSAGVGRTGTYIALDIITNEGESEIGVDIYACVRNMREQRVNMVQTPEQYRYLYNAVVHSLTFDCKPVQATKLDEYLNTHTDLSQMFKKIQVSEESRPRDEIEAVKRNKTYWKKNRDGADIPGDRHRPRLILNRNPDSSDYINAVYVDSFTNINRFIVAQTPLPETVDDFLTLIIQENVPCIINVDSSENEQSAGAYYWDSGPALETCMFTVTAEIREITDQYTFRKLKILYRSSSEGVKVNHIQITQWDDRTKVPEEPAKFVQLIKDIELKFFGGEKSGPVLVHCLTGAVKSGLFCVLSILLEQLQIDQEIGVVNIVLKVKSRRQMFIPNREQYIFCYRCMNEYICLFDTYSNFSLKL